MFGRDPIVPLNSLLAPTVRNLGTDENILSLEALKIFTSSLQVIWNKLERREILKPLY